MARLTATGDLWTQWRMRVFVVLGYLLLVAPVFADPNHIPEEACARKRYLREAWEQDKPDIIQLGICWFDKDIILAKQSIASEYALAKSSGGGIVDKSAIYAEQQRIRNDLNHIATLRSWLKAVKSKPLPCSAESMKKTLFCSVDGSADYCDHAPYSLLTETLSAFVDHISGVLQYEFCHQLPSPFGNDPMPNADSAPPAPAR